MKRPIAFRVTERIYTEVKKRAEAAGVKPSELAREYVEKGLFPTIDTDKILAEIHEAKAQISSLKEGIYLGDFEKKLDSILRYSVVGATAQAGNIRATFPGEKGENILKEAAKSAKGKIDQLIK